MKTMKSYQMTKVVTIELKDITYTAAITAFRSIESIIEVYHINKDEIISVKSTRPMPTAMAKMFLSQTMGLERYTADVFDNYGKHGTTEVNTGF